MGVKVTHHEGRDDGVKVEREYVGEAMSLRGNMVVDVNKPYSIVMEGDVQNHTSEGGKKVVSVANKGTSGKVQAYVDGDFASLMRTEGGKKTFPHVVGRCTADFDPVRVVIGAGDINLAKPWFLDKDNIV